MRGQNKINYNTLALWKNRQDNPPQRRASKDKQDFERKISRRRKDAKKKMNIQHRTSNVQRRMKKRTPNSEHSTTPRRGFFFSFPCSSVGMHTIWVSTLEHGNQAKYLNLTWNINLSSHNHAGAWLLVSLWLICFDQPRLGVVNC